MLVLVSFNFRNPGFPPHFGPLPWRFWDLWHRKRVVSASLLLPCPLSTMLASKLSKEESFESICHSSPNHEFWLTDSFGSTGSRSLSGLPEETSHRTSSLICFKKNPVGVESMSVAHIGHVSSSPVPRLVKSSAAHGRNLIGMEVPLNGPQLQISGPIRSPIKPRPVSLFLLSIPITVMSRCCVLNGRGHHSSIVSTSLSWLCDNKFQTLVQSTI